MSVNLNGEIITQRIDIPYDITPPNTQAIALSKTYFVFISNKSNKPDAVTSAIALVILLRIVAIYLMFNVGSQHIIN